MYIDIVNRVLIIERKVNEKHAARKKNLKKRNRLNEYQGQNSKNTKSSNKRLVNKNSRLSDSVKCSKCHYMISNRISKYQRTISIGRVQSMSA